MGVRARYKQQREEAKTPGILSNFLLVGVRLPGPCSPKLSTWGHSVTQGAHNKAKDGLRAGQKAQR